MTNMRPPNKTTLLKVVILGDGGVGKTCLMNRFVSNRYDEGNFHTIGVEFMNKDIEVEGVKYTLQIWDTAGQERFKALRTPFYRGSDICMLCFAVDDRFSFNNVNQWRREFLNFADVQPDEFPFIVVGNKYDIRPPGHQVAREEVAQWCEKQKIPIFVETSSKESLNVNAAFAMAVKQWQKLEKSTEKEMRDNGDTIDLTAAVHLPQSRFCCTSTPFGSGGSATNSPIRRSNEFDNNEL